MLHPPVEAVGEEESERFVKTSALRLLDGFRFWRHCRWQTSIGALAITGRQSLLVGEEAAG